MSNFLKSALSISNVLMSSKYVLFIINVLLSSKIVFSIIKNCVLFLFAIKNCSPSSKFMPSVIKTVFFYNENAIKFCAVFHHNSLKTLSKLYASSLKMSSHILCQMLESLGKRFKKKNIIHLIVFAFRLLLGNRSFTSNCWRPQWDINKRYLVLISCVIILKE